MSYTCCPNRDRAVDVENAIKLAAADDGFVTYEELRENLRKARFSDVEIDLFFQHFQVCQRINKHCRIN